MSEGSTTLYQVAGRELDPVELKAELFIEGVRIDPAACQGVGDIYKEQVHGQFDFDEDFHQEAKFPVEFKLSDGTLIPFKASSASPYLIKRDGGQLYVETRGEPITEISFERRPQFYDRKTSDGVLMHRVGQVADRDCLLFNYSSYCIHWNTGDECRFCNLVPTHSAYRQDVQSGKKTSQIAETTAAAFEEGVANKFNISGGTLRGRRDVDVYIRVMEAVGKQLEQLGKTSQASNVALGAVGPEDAQELKASGYTKITMDLEVWDQNLFAGICPGKAKTVGWKKWVDSLEAAAEIFGRGNVRSFFVTGLEPKESFLAGADYLAARGVLAFAIPWVPNPGSKYEGHRTPTPAWHLSVARELVKIWQRHGYTVEQIGQFPGSRIFLYYDVWAISEGKAVPA